MEIEHDIIFRHLQEKMLQGNNTYYGLVDFEKLMTNCREMFCSGTLAEKSVDRKK